MADGKYSDTLKQPGFLSFFWTQFLGAFNDNFYKFIITLVALNLPEETGGGKHYIPLIGGLFIAPFLLFSGYAGYLADIFSKRTIIVAVKIFEIFAMSLGLLAFYSERMELMLIIVFLMGLHSTFFSPAKYGILPEMLPQRDLSRGNGLLEMSTFIAIILGTSVGGLIYETWKYRLEFIGLLLIAVAVLGTVTSLGIAKVPPSGSSKLFMINPLSEVIDGTKRLRKDPSLWLTVMGISYFWFLGALMQMTLPIFGKDILALGETRVALLWTFTAIGIGLGSLAAGRLSGDRIELGLVPLGAMGMGLFSFLLYFAQSSFPAASWVLVFLGVAGGLFAVPLNALLQDRSGKEEKGLLIATNNVFNTVGVLLASLLLWTLGDILSRPADQVILIAGLITIAATTYILYLLPDFLVRFVLWLLTHTIYRIQILGEQNIPQRGPALLICNHVSFVDALLIGASMPRFVHFMLHRDYYDMKSLNWFFRLMRSIPVSATNRRDIVESLKRARNELDKGHVVCIFAEGAISRTGRVLPFKRGFEKIVEGKNVPIIPMHLDQVWGSIFSFKDGRFFWKLPKKWQYPVTVSFGAPLPPGSTVNEVRNAVLALESDAFDHRPSADDLLHTRFIDTAKRHWFGFCMADTTDTELTYGKTLIGAFLLARWIHKQCPNEPMICVILLT